MIFLRIDLSSHFSQNPATHQRKSSKATIPPSYTYKQQIIPSSTNHHSQTKEKFHILFHGTKLSTKREENLFSLKKAMP